MEFPQKKFNVLNMDAKLDYIKPSSSFARILLDINQRVEAMPVSASAKYFGPEALQADGVRTAGDFYRAWQQIAVSADGFDYTPLTVTQPRKKDHAPS